MPSPDAHRQSSDETAMKQPMVMMAVEHYAAYRWVQAPIVALGLWLLLGPFTFGYERAGMIWSEVFSGSVAVVMALFALRPSRGVVSWSIGSDVGPARRHEVTSDEDQRS